MINLCIPSRGCACDELEATVADFGLLDKGSNPEIGFRKGSRLTLSSL
jgi:hypothetical protein